MPKRPEGVPEILPIDKNLVQNGDTFDIMRLDGLDPMIAFAMGAATGHTAIALWKEKEVNTVWTFKIVIFKLNYDLIYTVISVRLWNFKDGGS